VLLLAFGCDPKDDEESGTEENACDALALEGDGEDCPTVKSDGGEKDESDGGGTGGGTGPGNGGMGEFPSDEGGSESVPTLSLTFASPNRSIYVDDETEVRTVDIQSDSIELECSSNDGASWSSCSGGSYQWDAANYGVVHRVRALNDFGPKELSFTPSAELPDLTFVSCDFTVPGNAMDNDSFESLVDLTSGNRVICLSDGLNVTKDGDDTSTGLFITAPGLTFIAREGDHAQFNNDTVNVAAIEIRGVDDTRLVGFHVDTTNGWGIYNRFYSGNGSLDTIMHNLNVSCTAPAAPYCIRNNSNHTSANPLVLRQVDINHISSGSGAGLHMDGGYIDIADSYIVSNYMAVNMYFNASGLFTKVGVVSERTSAGVTPAAINLYRMAQMTMNDSSVKVNGNPAVGMEDIGTATTGSTIEFNRTKFIRNNAALGDSPVFYLDTYDGSSAGHAVNSTDNGNEFCFEEDTADAKFDEVFDSGGQANAGNLSVAAQINSGSIGLCD
jgi:hypothetical protein